MHLLKVGGRYIHHMTVGLISGFLGGLSYFFLKDLSDFTLENCLQFNFQDIHAQVALNPKGLNYSQIIDDIQAGQPIHVPLNISASLSPEALTVNPDCVQMVTDPLLWGAIAGVFTGTALTVAYDYHQAQARHQKNQLRVCNREEARLSLQYNHYVP